jgi:hypothetical protein
MSYWYQHDMSSPTYIHFPWENELCDQLKGGIATGHDATSVHSIASFDTVKYRKTREGWSLLSVETEANGTLTSNERGPSLVGSLGSSCRDNGFLSFLGCSSHRTLIHFISPHSPTRNLGRQSCWVACLCVSGHSEGAADEAMMKKGYYNMLI